MYCKIIGQLSTEFLLTNILLDREAPPSHQASYCHNSWSTGKAFFFRGPKVAKNRFSSSFVSLLIVRDNRRI
jgi:hypothetical protein